jgi:3-dehydroquinate synthase
MHTLEVSLAERSYPIHVGRNVLERAGDLLQRLPSRRVVILSNAAVASHWLAPLRTSLASAGFRSDVVLVPDGETHKSWTTLHDVLTRLLELRVERSTALIALGGGVVGDLTGFASAVYQRGTPFVQVGVLRLARAGDGRIACARPRCAVARDRDELPHQGRDRGGG